MPAPDFSDLVAQIVAAVETNPGAPELPWHRAGLHIPTNAVTKNSYKGINVLSLWMGAMRRSFHQPLWASYRQWSSIGAQVRRGERGTPIIFYSEAPAATDTDERRKPVIRSSTVFCADQVEGFEAPSLPAPAEPWARFEPAEAFIKRVGADIRHGGDEAFFAPGADYIQLPHPESFIGTKSSSARDAYYSTLLHELGHWTGVSKRLNRDLSGRFGSRAYAAEELVAELTAAFACAELGVTPTMRPDHAKYAANWVSLLRDDAQAIKVAAGKAAVAMDYLRSGEVN